MESREASRIRGRTLVLLASVAAIASVEQCLLALPTGVGLAVVAGVLALVYAATPERAPLATDGGTWVRVGAFTAFALGVFFRLRYLSIVPVGWGSEPLAFVRFAQHLVDGGFPYEPYSWYAHTLYSYFIAAAMLVAPSDLMAFRMASAAISMATVVSFFLALRSLLGGRVATVAVALLASSFWHLFASRNGYHQQLLPLFQSLFLYGLAEGLLHDRFRGWLIAAAAMTAGLHAHWGFYLMPVYAGVVWAYLWWRQRWLWQRQARSMATAALVTTIWSSPLVLFFYYNSQTFDYVLHGFTPGASSAPNLLNKLCGNLRYLGWAYSGNAFAPIEFGTQVDMLVATAGLIGLAVCSRWCAKSVPHALLLLLLAVNLAGLIVTLASIFYITATLVAVYGLAAVGIVAIVDQIDASSHRLLPLAALAVVAAIGWQATRNYEEFFGQRIYSELREPFRPPGTYFLLLDRIRDSVKHNAVFVARDEPGRDFDAPSSSDREGLVSMAFAAATRPFDVETILFAPAYVGEAEAVEVWVPNVAVVARLLVPSLQSFYPGLTVTPVAAPEPYAARSSEAVALRVTIPRAEVVAYHGLRDGKGLFYAPLDGRFEFRVTSEATAGSLLLHGQTVELSQRSSVGVLLEHGLHPVQVVDAASGAIEMRVDGGDWQRLDDFLLNPNAHAAVELAPYLAHPGKIAEFYYQQRLSLARPGDVRAVEVEPGLGGGFITAAGDAIRWHSRDGGVERQLALGNGIPLLLRHTAIGLIRVDEDGTWWRVTPERSTRGGVVGCAPVEIVDSDPVGVVCRNGSVRQLAIGDGNANERNLDPQATAIADAASSGGQLFAADDGNGRLWRFGSDRRGSDWHAMAGIYFDSEIEADASGNLYVKRWGAGVRTYSADGHLLFNPNTGRPALLMRAVDVDADVSLLRRLRFGGDQAVALGAHDFVYRFERVATAPSAAR